MRKIFSVFIAFILTAGMIFCVSADAPQVLRALHPEFSERIFDISLDDAPVARESLSDMSAHPGSVLRIVLSGESENADLFLDQNGLPMNIADVTASRLRAARVSVQVEASEGSFAVEGAELTVRNAGSPFSRPVIEIYFAKSFAELSPIDFSFDVFVTMGGVRQPQSGMTVSGIFGNREITAGADDTAIAPDGAVILAEADVPSVEIDAGYGVFVTAALRAGERYRAASAPSSEPGDLNTLALDARLVDIILIDYSGFQPGDVKEVHINTEENLFVYDEHGKFIGMTSGSLPPGSKYLLATRRIEL